MTPKQYLSYFILSVIMVMFASYAHLLIVYIDILYTYINVKLSHLFNPSFTGTMIRNVLILVLLPVAIAGVPALIYRLIKGKMMPYFIETIWLLWLIIVLSKVLIH